MGGGGTQRQAESRLVAAQLDFGEVWEDDKFRWTIPVTNEGQESVTIKDFVSTCTCSGIEPRSLVIPAGETRDVRVTLDLRPTKDVRFDLAPFRFAIDVVPHLEAGKAKWNLRGKVRPAVRFNRPVVDFGLRSEWAAPWPAQRVAVLAAPEVAELTASSGNPAFQAEVMRSSEKKGRFELVVRPGKELPCENYTFEVLVTPKLSDGKALGPQRVAVRGSVVRDIYASTPQVVFGARPVGETAEETLTLSSHVGQAFRVVRVVSSLIGLQVTECAKTSSPTNPAYLLRQRITSAGEQAGTVTFSCRTADDRLAEVVFAVSYHGLPSTQG